MYVGNFTRQKKGICFCIVCGFWMLRNSPQISAKPHKTYVWDRANGGVINGGVSANRTASFFAVCKFGQIRPNLAKIGRICKSISHKFDQIWRISLCAIKSASKQKPANLLQICRLFTAPFVTAPFVPV